jgi:hypothetical protein
MGLTAFTTAVNAGEFVQGFTGGYVQDESLPELKSMLTYIF